MNWKNIAKPCKKLLASSGGASSGRNSAGRITIFHRGGGSKRQHRNVDLKRNTSSTGIVERIEYDPNRSSKIALVRWIEGVEENKTPQRFTPSRNQALEPISATVSAQFPLGCLSPGLTTKDGTVNITSSNNKLSSLRDVLSSGLASAGAQQTSSFLNFPRISVSGAKPGFFVPRLRGEVNTREEEEFAIPEIRKWKRDSVLWAQRSKRKAAFSWQSILRNNMSLGIVKDGGNVELKSEKEEESTLHGKQIKLQSKFSKDCIPVSYILASNDLEAGSMVMNCDASKSSRKEISSG